MLLSEIDDLLARNNIKKAEILIAKYLRADLPVRERATALIQRARIRLRSLRPEEAIEDILLARELMPATFDNPETLELLGDSYLARFESATVGFADRGDTTQAHLLYSQILEQSPNYSNRGWVYYQLGRIALSDNLVDKAEEALRQALLTPSHVRALTAYCYERLGFLAFYERRELQLAMGFLDKAVDTYPASENQAWLVQVHILRSRVLREQRAYRQAIVAAETAVTVAVSVLPEQRPILAEALLTAGEMLAGFAGRERDSINYLQQFLQITRKPLGVDVTWSRVHEMLGDAYFNLMQHDLATEAYEAALHYNPYNPWEISLHYRIAQSYYQQSDYGSAVNAIQRLLSIAQDDNETVQDYRVFDVLGNAKFALGQYAEAEAAYQRALEIAPPNAEGLDKIRRYHQFAQDLG